MLNKIKRILFKTSSVHIKVYFTLIEFSSFVMTATEDS